MTQHTPGPWLTQPTLQNHGVTFAWSIGPAVTGVLGLEDRVGHRIVAIVKDVEADARLIGAAPDLAGALRALEPFLDAIVCYASTMGEHEPNRLAANARAALAKAGVGHD